MIIIIVILINFLIFIELFSIWISGIRVFIFIFGNKIPLFWLHIFQIWRQCFILMSILFFKLDLVKVYSLTAASWRLMNLFLFLKFIIFINCSFWILCVNISLSFLKYWNWSSLWILFFFILLIIFIIKMFLSAIYFLTSWLWIFRWRNFLFNNITEYIRIHIFIFILNCNLIILFINLILNLYLLLILYIIVNLILFKLLILIKRMFLFDLIIVIYI